MIENLKLVVIRSLVLGIFATFWIGSYGCGGKQFDEWVATDGDVQVVVTAYREQYRFNAGAYYTFEFSRGGEKQLIMSFRQDDLNPISRNTVVFVNDQVIYAYIGWKYIVTTNRGETWSEWNGEHSLAHWKCCNYHLIDEVILHEDGEGRMQLSGMGQIGPMTLITDDFGRTWNTKVD